MITNAQRMEGIATLRMPRTGHALRIDFSALDQLQAVVEKGLRAPPRGAEVGGLLIGSVNGAKEIDVEGVVEIACGAVEGPFRFALADCEVLQALIPGNEARLVGLYRSDSRDSAIAIDEERALLAELLPDARLIWIVRSAGPLQCTCHVYIRRSWRRWTEAGEITLPSLSVSAPRPRRGTSIQSPASISRLPPMLVAHEPRIEAAQERAVANCESAIALVPRGDLGALRTRRMVVPGVVIASFVCLSLGAFFAVMRSPWNWWRGSSPVSTAGTSTSRTEWPLDLQAQRQDGDLKVTWSRDATAVLRATSGVLTIEDGTKRQLTLDPTLVHRGSILYAPTTDQVKIELTISTPQGPASDSFFVILPTGGPPRLTARTMDATSRSERGETAPPSGFGEQHRATRAFALPAMPQTAETGALFAVLDESPPVRAGVAVLVSALPALLPQLPDPPAPGSAEEPRPDLGRPDNSGSSPKSPVRAAQAYEPPAVVKRATPSYPPSLRAMISVLTSVQVRVSIDESGRVVTVDHIPQDRALPPLIVKSAMDAARMWKFAPARKDNKPIPSEVILRFQFRPN